MGGFSVEVMVSFIVGLVVLYVILKVLSLPFKIVWKLFTNSLVGAIMLWVVNLFGAGIEITFFKALLCCISATTMYILQQICTSVNTCIKFFSYFFFP